jgi:WD40 repeat protein
VKLTLLGGLKVEGSPLTRPKPLLLLAYLALEGSRDRRDLAELFFQGSQNPGQGLRVSLAHLNKEAPGAVRASEKRLWTELDSDVVELETAITEGHFEKALALYKGPFLEGLELSDLGEELEEWLYKIRERVAAHVREAKIHLAERVASQGNFSEAASLAEKAYLLRYAPEPERDVLERLYTLLRAGEAPTESIVKEAKSYDLELSLTVDEARAKLQTLDPRVQVLPPNPYVGLLAFQERDAPFFFGRERAATDILQRCGASPFVVTVIGNSGAGKSSLVFAGVLPQLRKDNWLLCTLRPGRQPFEALALALSELLETPSENVLESQALAKALQEKKLELTTLVSSILSNHPQRRLLIMVDQLEELFTINQHSTISQYSTTTEGSSEAANFLEVLLGAVQKLRGQFSLIVTLRADFIGALLEYPPILNMLQETRYFLGPMNEAELRVAIAEPARKQGVSFEAGLVQRILEDVSGQEGSLPLLEFALTQLWEKQDSRTLTHHAYDTIGGVEEALANHADMTFNTLSESEQPLAKKVFLQLVYPGTGQEDTRRIATRGELEDGWELVQKLASYPARLLVTGYSEIGEQTAEVSHEALIRRWGLLRTWMSDYRLFRTWQERLRQDVKLWSEQAQIELTQVVPVQTKPTYVKARKVEATLLRGYRLDEAAQRMKQDEKLLSANEREFIQQSLALREREAAERNAQRQAQLESLEKLAAEETSRRKAEQARVRLRTNALWLLTLLGCVAGVLAIISYTARNQAIPARNEATSLQPKLLSAVALNTKEDLPQRSLLLALEAERMASENHQADLPTIQGVLRQIVSETGGTPLPQSGSVVATNFNHTGSWLATLSDDGSVRLWRKDSFSADKALKLTGETDGLKATTLKFSPDGSSLVVGYVDSSIRFWDMTSAEPRALKTETEKPSEEGGVRLLKFSLDGKYLLSSTQEGKLTVWDLSAFPLVRQGTVLGEAGDTLVGAAFSGDGRYLITVTTQSRMRVWDVKTWQVVREVTEEAFRPFTLLSSRAGTWLSLVMVNGDSSRVLLWKTATLATQTPPIRLELDAQVKSLAFSSGDDWLAVGTDKGQVNLWATTDLNADNPNADNPNADNLSTDPVTLQSHSEAIFDVSFSPDDRYLATASADKTARLYFLPTLAALRTPQKLFSLVLRGHEGSLDTLAFSPDGHWLVTGSDDHTARVWNLHAPSPDLTVLALHSEPERRAELSSDGKLLATGNVDGTVYLESLGNMSASTVSANTVLAKHDSWVESLALSPDGKFLASTSDASGGAGKLLELHDLMRASFVTATLPEAAKTLFDVSFSSDSQWLATASEDKTAQLWRVSDLSKPVRVFAGHDDLVTEVAFSPDGMVLATASFDHFVRVWNVEDSSTPLQKLAGHRAGVRTLAFSPDGKLLASGGSDGQVILWNTQTWKSVITLQTGSRVWALAFGPDGTLATANEDGSLALWQPGSKTLVRLTGHTDTAWSVAFNKDWIVTTSQDGTIRFWPAFMDDVRRLACQKAGRNLSKDEWQDMFGTMTYQITCPQFSESY